MLELKINGQAHEYTGDPEMPLLWYLRDELSLTGTKFGCGLALCGACTVHVDGSPTRSCMTTVGSIAGLEITTIETAERARVGQVLQAAWVGEQVPQCGYCQSGQIMSAMALLVAKPGPTDADIDAAMSGNICRCATYQGIRSAIHKAAEALNA
jgi:isoquinoline 1-oxidoreductase/isoquinoline 1-oxidoreductase alpha subunit